MNWQEKAKYLLENHQVEGLAEWCEEGINSGNGGSFPYWYLGLVYLLQGNIEQAQGVWLSGLFEASGEEDSDQRTEGLVGVLESEAQRREELGELEVSVELRQQLQEVNPSFNNLLKLLALLAKTNHFRGELIKEWEVIETLKEASPNEINQEQLPTTVLLILEASPFEEMEELITLTFNLLEDGDNFLEKVLNIGIDYNYQKARPNIGIKLAETCCQLKPNFGKSFKYLSHLCSRSEEHKKAITVAKKYQSFCHSLTQKVEGSRVVLEASLTAGDWLEIPDAIAHHKWLLREIIKNPPETIESDSYDGLGIATFFLAYLGDQAVENRWLQNQIAKLYQKYFLDIHSEISYSKENRDLTKNRRLKIGYIAHTFRKNAVGWLCRWLVQNHTKKEFHVTLYLIYQHEDELTQGFVQEADEVRRFDYNERAIAQQIVDDEIDILIDLDSLTVTPTCRTLCYRVAPIQVTWLGWDASGLPNMDYYIADPYVLPEKAQEYYHETIWRLPHTYVAVKGFEVGTPSVKREDLDIPESAIVYFSSQGGLKRHPDTVRLQMRVLKAVPNSYFLIKGRSDQELIQNFFQEIAEEEGVDLNRLRFLPWSPNEFIHRANLDVADVVLDTYPYNGATTTLETLWMGIPLVTKVGQQFVARNSYTFLKNAGVEEGIAWSDEEYVEWGIKFGTDETLREEVHWKLIQSRKTSPLWDLGQFIEEMESAYKQMWEKYVSERKATETTKTDR